MEIVTDTFAQLVQHALELWPNGGLLPIPSLERFSRKPAFSCVETDPLKLPVRYLG
jgi:hypothetical protein